MDCFALSKISGIGVEFRASGILIPAEAPGETQLKITTTTYVEVILFWRYVLVFIRDGFTPFLFATSTPSWERYAFQHPFSHFMFCLLAYVCQAHGVRTPTPIMMEEVWSFPKRIGGNVIRIVCVLELIYLKVSLCSLNFGISRFFIRYEHHEEWIKKLSWTIGRETEKKMEEEQISPQN